MSELRVAVVGAGIVGLAVAYQLFQSGVRVTIIDRDPEGDKASFGNAGAIAVTEVVPASAPGVFWRVPGWMLDPTGPLAVRPAYAPRLIPWLTRFARVASAVTIRVTLTNGRRAEIELQDMQGLSEVLGALECPI